MDKLLTAIESFVTSQAGLVLIACACLILVLIIAMIAMRRKQRAEMSDWQEECRHLSGRVDALDAEKKEKSLQLEKEQQESARSKEDYSAQLQARDEDYAAQIKAKDDELAAQLQAKDEYYTAQIAAMNEEFQAREAELTARIESGNEDRAALIKSKDEELAAQLLAMDNDCAALIEAKDAALAAQLQAKDKELAAMQEKLDSWGRERDEIVADAHRTAEHILSEAAQRLAESEEEVRKNRLVAASSLTDARRRISEMLLTAAGELCKGIPANSPIGYAPVYSIEDANLSPLSEESDAETEEE